ncbi:MAG TPA: HIT family protein [Moraxellaceae bacterium]|nr:HIT family protein [Moraxellaceae bacterium]
MTDCVFCRIVRGELPATRLHEDEHVIAFMDIFPLRRGHVLVIPRAHHQHLHQLPAALRAHLIDTGARISRALYDSTLAPAAVHFAINDGPEAHQTVPHVHLHVLPRYRGDGGRFLLRLLRKPLDLVIGPVKTESLTADATAIRASLSEQAP